MRGRILFAAVVCLACWIATPSGQGGPASARAVDGEIIVKFKPGTTQARRDAALTAIGGGRIKHFDAIDQDHVRLPRGRKAAEAIAGLVASGDVESAQPNYTRRITAAPPPNDFLWVNDTANGFYGLKKIQADLVWAAPHNNTGSSSIVVADIDTGVKYTHPDLAGNMWVNPGEIPGNAVDDDGNGYVDDVHGIDAFNHDSDPMDDNGHGTHTAGTFGAVGNNGPDYLTGTATVGVNWTVGILACKFLDANGDGTDAGAIECLNYITMMKNRGVNIRVSNNSWGGYRDTAAPFPQALKDAVDAAGNAGILNVFAAGNDNVNIETFPHDPASFDSPSIVSVAASRENDGKATFSNFGTTSVDLAAPGVLIPSTWIGTDYSCFGSLCGYAKLDGTSMATPHVAGAAALLLAGSNVSVAGLKALLLNNVDTLTQWSTRVATGGRLNVFKAANAQAANPPPSVTITSPAMGASFSEPASFAFAADATDGTGTVTHVSFYVNSTFVTSDNSSPYSIVLGGLTVGTYTLTAEATDNFGAIGVSPPVQITVTGGTPQPTALLSASSRTFGKQLVGSTSAPQSVNIFNIGPGPLVFNSFNGAPPSSPFTVGTGNFQGQTDCPLITGLAPFTQCTFTFQSSPTVTGPHGDTFSISTNATNSPHSISLSGHGFIVDEATVNQTIASGGMRLQNLQNPNDGGWNFNVASDDCGTPGVSCPNIVGVTALALLKAYERDPSNSALLNDAIDAGNRLTQVYNTVPRAVPYSQDLEFLMALYETTLDAQWSTMAADWFLTVTAAHANGADRVDFLLATRGTIAAWDSASLIRSAKAVGQADYALEVANRIHQRQPDWLGVGNQSHTWLGAGSLLWAWHDLEGFDFQIDAFRDFLLNTQDPATGLWDNGNLQTTAYVINGLAAVGGAGTDAAIRAAVASYIANQLPSGGWTFLANGVDEFSNVDGEVTRAIATLYSTQAGASVQVAPAQLSRVRFDQVSASGATTVVALDRSAAGSVPLGYSLVSGLTYEILTTAVASGNITVCLAVPWAATAGVFDKLRILHAEDGVFVDRTIRAGVMAPDFGSKRVCALVSSLDAFAVGMVDETIAPQLSVTLSPAVLSPANNQMVTVTATIVVSDNADPSPVITLMSIMTADGPSTQPTDGSTSPSASLRTSKHPKREDVQGAVVGTDDRTFSLRAERGERGAERVYTITYRATDRSGNSTDASATVVVPRRR
jgi:subtilisin family serine protease